MRISFVCKQLNVEKGGSNHSLHLTARLLCARGHEIRVITLKPELNALPDDPPYTVVEPDRLELPTRVGMSLVERAVLREWEDDTDVFHVYNPNFLTGAALYRRTGGTVPVVGRLNSYNLFCTNLDRMNGVCHEHCTTTKKLRHSFRSTGRRYAMTPLYASRTHLEPALINETFDALFAISPAVKDVYREIGIDADLIRVRPNFYDPEFQRESYPDGGRASSPPNREEVRLLYVGRLIEAKNISLLLDALTLVDDTLSLDVVGDGPAVDSLVEQASRLGLDEQVTFHGWVDHDSVIPFYDRADAFVHPGRWPEPFGRSVLEALQRRCPPVVSDVGGPPWIVGEAGVVFESNDPLDLAAAIERALDPERHARLRANCPREVERFSPDRSVDVLETDYDRLVTTSTTGRERG